MKAYKFVGKTCVPISESISDLEIEKAFADKNRILKQTHVGSKMISTVFLVLDHNFSLLGGPVLFETMIFPKCEYVERSRTYDSALAEHEKAVQLVKDGLDEKEE